jgi:hypothetical protein
MNLETLSIEPLAELRDEVISTLNDRARARQTELQGEVERLGGVVSSEPRKQSTGRFKKPVKFRDRNVWPRDYACLAKLKGVTLESYRVT